MIEMQLLTRHGTMPGMDPREDETGHGPGESQRAAGGPPVPEKEADGAGAVEPSARSEPPASTAATERLPQVPYHPATQPQIIQGYPVGPQRRPTPMLRWWSHPATMIIVMLTILALVVATLSLAFHVLTSDTSVVAAPTSAPTTTVPSPDTPVAPPIVVPTLQPPTPTQTQSPVPGTVPEAQIDELPRPPVPPNTRGTPYTSGILRLNAGDAFDFDAGSINSANFRRDVVVSRHGIVGVNAVSIAVYGADSVPILSDCAEVPVGDWVQSISTGQVIEATHICYFTTEGRYGYLTLQEVNLTTDGGLAGFQMTYLVWRGPNERA
jgi:hypothetical protein